MSTKPNVARRAALLQLVKQPAPLDRTPQNRVQRRLADRFLRRQAAKRLGNQAA
jgi:hypothetical protein